ncbi:MAG: aconitate hydratase AcnA, partial [Vicinamibacterales bacterium]
MPTLNSFGTRTPLTVGGDTYQIYSLPALAKTFPGVTRLPFSMKVLLENLLRREDNAFVKADDIKAVASWDAKGSAEKEISFMPARVLLQDFTGVPCVVDLAAMRDAIVALGGNPDRVNPLQPVELVIDHSVQVDYFARPDALALNAELEFSRNKERYAFMRWGQKAFNNFKVVPPDTGIVHQVNIEYLARVVFSETVDGEKVAYPDTLVGTDSHTTMVNGLGVVGWGVGGIEAEAAMLGQPSSMLIPKVLGVRLTGRLREGITATDLVLTVTERLRKHGVVGKFVEFYGEGLAHLTIADRSTLGNMCPEYGATVAIFPIDGLTLDYLRLTNRDASRVALVEAYAKAQGMWREDGAADPVYSETIEIDLNAIEPSLAGPKRPQDRVSLSGAKPAFHAALPGMKEQAKAASAKAGAVAVAEQPVEGLVDGSVVIAAITSCTNTSNPSVLVAAGLLAKKAAEKGLTRKPWVKTSLAPGSKVVTEYLDAAGLSPYLDQLGFHTVGYGCTTCIGNSGPLPDDVTATIRQESLVVASVLSGNRNFEGRIQQDVRANYLASPPLVVAYAIAGSMLTDITTEPLGTGKDGKPVYLKDVWPTSAEIQETVTRVVTAKQFKESYANVFDGDARWQGLQVPDGSRFAWEGDSTYIRRPTFLEGMTMTPPKATDILGARVLALLGDSVTTDHISPAGNIKADSPAGKYLTGHGVKPADFNSYGARRGNHEVMMRGTFANTRLRNLVAPGTEGGWTTLLPDGGVMSIYDASVKYRDAGTPL